MDAIPVIAVFDVGKTNKKLFLFDEKYQIVFEKSGRFIETVDEDGFPCENLESLRLSVFDSLSEIFRLKQFQIKAVNFSTYGASFIYIGEDGKPLTPLYNYLKAYPESLSDQFYSRYDDGDQFSTQTASPQLGSLNSGLQLYRLKQERPDLFNQVKYALHLPQYLSFLLTGNAVTDITSIGCHTAMWDFKKSDYHQWLQLEGITEKLAPIASSNAVCAALFPGDSYKVGIGLHDSSAALIPYLINFNEAFILISTGTWCISLNPFNDTPLTADELKNDCLCYLQYQGKPVKASRLFSGQEHEQQVKRIAAHFNQDVIKFRDIEYDPEVIQSLKNNSLIDGSPKEITDGFTFRKADLSHFKNATEAYHQLIADLVNMQLLSTNLIITAQPSVKRLFVDGGFSKNNIYMHLLAAAFPGLEVFSAAMPQASALGAALVIHKEWNKKPIPSDLIGLKYYSDGRAALI